MIHILDPVLSLKAEVISSTMTVYILIFTLILVYFAGNKVHRHLEKLAANEMGIREEE